MIHGHDNDPLSEAVDAVDAIVDLLATHGPTTCNVGLRATADVGRQGLDGSVDPMEAAVEMQRRLGVISRPLSDVVVQADDDAERVRLNTHFETLTARLDLALRRATQSTRRLGRIGPVLSRDTERTSSPGLNRFEILSARGDPRSPRPVAGSSDDQSLDEAVEFWVRFSCDSQRTVDVLRTRESECPVVRISGTRRSRRIVGIVDGLSARSVERASVLLRTSWTARRADGGEMFRVTERTVDALWRRCIRPIPRGFRSGVPDLFGAVVSAPLLLLAKAKPSCRMSVFTPDGETIGSITIASDLRDASEHVLVSVTNTEYVVDVVVIALATSSVMH